MVAHFRTSVICAEFKGATVSIDRDLGLFIVRPRRRRKLYVLPLATVAAIIVSKCAKAEVRAKRAERKARRGR